MIGPTRSRDSILAPLTTTCRLTQFARHDERESEGETEVLHISRGLKKRTFIHYLMSQNTALPSLRSPPLPCPHPASSLLHLISLVPCRFFHLFYLFFFFSFIHFCLLFYYEEEKWYLLLYLSRVFFFYM